MTDDDTLRHQRFAPTHYEVLGVAANADQATIRRAYHEAARRWHPDRRGALAPADAARAEDEMRRVNQAWAVLSRADRRRAYDSDLRRGMADQPGPARPAGVRSDDGIVRIDPRLLDPDFLAARRHLHYDDISKTHSVILRVVPVVFVLGLLVAIFVFTAYARGGGDAAVSTTVPGPNLGQGIEANMCVTVLGGPSLLARPCDANADGRVIGARMADVEGSVCPLGTVREVTLANGVVACLGAVN